MKRLTYNFFVFLLIFFHSSFLYSTNDFKAYFVDVGQGSCTIVRAKNSPLLLFDSGTCSLRKEHGCIFRSNPVGNSVLIRAVIPVQSGQ